MKKLELRIEELQVASFATMATPEWKGTVAAHEITTVISPFPCTTKDRTCPITYGCPSTTP